jgi:hypothetical protein
MIDRFMIKSKFPLHLINKSPSHEDVWGSWDMEQPFLTSALDEAEQSSSHPDCFTSAKTAPYIH